MRENRQGHGDHIYETKAEREQSWYQEIPAISLDLIRPTGVKQDGAIIDIGCGASRLVDALLAEGFWDLTVLNFSEKVLATAKSRLGPKVANVTWIAADVTRFDPLRTYNLTFLDGNSRPPSLCGMRIAGDWPSSSAHSRPVMRHDGASGRRRSGKQFRALESHRQVHVTPGSKTQSFRFSLFQRNA